MRKKAIGIISVLFFLLFVQCEKDKDFKYDLNLLTGKEWDMPQIQYTGPSGGDFILGSPTKFYEDGRVTFAGRTDYWQVRDSRSLLIQQRQQIWQVLELTENKLRVEVLKYPNGEFLVQAIFYPLEK